MGPPGEDKDDNEDKDEKMQMDDEQTQEVKPIFLFNFKILKYSTVFVRILSNSKRICKRK